jgi:hypothetical protein
MRGRSSRRVSARQLKAPPRAQRLSSHEPPREEEPEASAALWRVKNDRVGPAGPRDVMALQRSLGNKGVRRVLDQYGGVRRAGADEVLAFRDGAIQRHSIPEARKGVGDEDEEIPAQRFVQRQPEFGRPAPRERSRNRWGNGSAHGVQRKNGKGGGGATGVKDPGAAGAKDAAKGGSADAAKGGAKEDEASKKAAEAEFKDYAAGGPYRINNYVPDTVDDFGRFDAIYNPAARTLTADMRVKFTFPDMPLPERGGHHLGADPKTVIQVTHATYIANFLGRCRRVGAGSSLSAMCVRRRASGEAQPHYREG